jgi:hypothetical protein
VIRTHSRSCVRAGARHTLTEFLALISFATYLYGRPTCGALGVMLILLLDLCVVFVRCEYAVAHACASLKAMLRPTKRHGVDPTLVGRLAIAAKFAQTRHFAQTACEEMVSAASGLNTVA